MLNITKRISLCHRTKAEIRSYKRRHNGTFAANSWGSINSSVKNEISKKLLFNQNYKCAYCERSLFTNSPEIDHFAHKGNYPEFSFITTNLFYACKLCNSVARKGQKNTIWAHSPNYKACTFRIIHPFFHNPNNEIYYKDQDRVDIDWLRCSPLGKITIVFFGFHDGLYTKIRSENSLLEMFSDYTTTNDKELISFIVSYKPR